MRSIKRQFEKVVWPIMTGSFVVSAQKEIIYRKTGNRDGPLIFHMRDGPPNDTGPPGGTGPPDIFNGGTGPPNTTGLPMEWLARKKTLKKLKNKCRESLETTGKTININNLIEINRGKHNEN